MEYPDNYFRIFSIDRIDDNQVLVETSTGDIKFQLSDVPKNAFLKMADYRVKQVLTSVGGVLSAEYSVVRKRY